VTDTTEQLPSTYVGDESFKSLGSSLNNAFACRQMASRHLTQTEYSTWPQSNASYNIVPILENIGHIFWEYYKLMKTIATHQLASEAAW